MRVLVVDDNPDMIASLKLLLERHGHQVEGCTRAAACLLQQGQDPFDVLITDIFMPDVDGLQVIQEVRARWPGTAIVAMSGGGQVVQQDYLAVACDLGADIALRKPFDPDALVRALSEFERRRAHAPDF
ncbi:MAG TPA: response regulator [Burkholderiaceae bacterium]|nr:response regulator [Burkholderiaceae bacterium]